MAQITDLFSHGSGGWKVPDQVKGKPSLVSGKDSLPGAHMVAFSLWPRMALPPPVGAEKD